MVQDQKVTEIFKKICEAEGALMFVDENGVIQFWKRQHMNGNTTSQWTFDYENLTDIEWDNTPIVNSAVVVAKPMKRVAFNKVWESGQAYAIPPGGSLDVFADFRDDVGNYPVLEIVTPVEVTTAVTSSYQTNFAEDGTGADAKAAVSMTSTYLFGERYRMTFANSGVTNAYVTKIQLYGIPAKVQVIDSQEQTDEASVEDYGINPDNGGDTITINNDVVQDSATANALAYIFIRNYAEPLTRLKCSVFGVPQLQLGDYVTVVEETTGQELSMVLVGHELEVSKNGKLKQNLDLEERAPFAYFTIGISTIGGSDTLAP